MIDLRSQKDVTRLLQVMGTAAILQSRAKGLTKDEDKEMVMDSILESNDIVKKQTGADKAELRRLLILAIRQLETTTLRPKKDHAAYLSTHMAGRISSKSSVDLDGKSRAAGEGAQSRAS